MIYATLFLAMCICASALLVSRSIVLARRAPPPLPIPPCPDCGESDSLLIVEYQGTRRFSCQRCPRVYSATRDGRTFKHDPRALPFSPQPQLAQPPNGTQTVPPRRPDDRPIPRQRPIP